MSLPKGSIVVCDKGYDDYSWYTVLRKTRSTLARVNEQQPSEFYEALFSKLYRRCQANVPRHPFRFNNPLYSIDSSLIDLSLKLFPWGHFALG